MAQGASLQGAIELAWAHPGHGHTQGSPSIPVCKAKLGLAYWIGMGKPRTQIESKLTRNRPAINPKSIWRPPGSTWGDPVRSGTLPGGVQRGLGAPLGPPEALPERPEAAQIDPKTPSGDLRTTFASDFFAERVAGGPRNDFRLIFDPFLGAQASIPLHRGSVS